MIKNDGFLPLTSFMIDKCECGCEPLSYDFRMSVANSLYFLCENDLFTFKFTNPAVDFQRKVKAGEFSDITDDDYGKMVSDMKKQSVLYGDYATVNFLDLCYSAIRLMYKDDAILFIADLCKHFPNFRLLKSELCNSSFMSDMHKEDEIYKNNKRIEAEIGVLQGELR